MYVAPGPRVQDDPNFPVRIAAFSVAMLAIADSVSSSMPPLAVALPVSFALTLRGAFNPAKMAAFGIALPAMTWLFGLFFAITREIPALMVLGAFTLIFLGIHITRQTGNVLGFMIGVISVLLSTMALQHRAMLDIMRDEIITSCISGAIVLVLLYALIPTRTRIIHEDHPQPADRSLLAGSVLRAAVVTGYCFWLYAVLPAQDMLMGLAALFPLVYPGRRAMVLEARERMLGTAFGLAATIAILGIFVQAPSMIVLMVLFALSGLGFGMGMMRGRRPVLVHQFAHSVMLSTVMTALSSQAAIQAVLSRYGLTLAGAVGAVLVVVLVEEMAPRLFRNPSGAASP